MDWSASTEVTAVPMSICILAILAVTLFGCVRSKKAVKLRGGERDYVTQTPPIIITRDGGKKYSSDKDLGLLSQCEGAVSPSLPSLMMGDQSDVDSQKEQQQQCVTLWAAHSVTVPEQCANLPDLPAGARQSETTSGQYLLSSDVDQASMSSLEIVYTSRSHELSAIDLDCVPSDGIGVIDLQFQPVTMPTTFTSTTAPDTVTQHSESVNLQETVSPSPGPAETQAETKDGGSSPQYDLDEIIRFNSVLRPPARPKPPKTRHAKSKSVALELDLEEDGSSPSHLEDVETTYTKVNHTSMENGRRSRSSSPSDSDDDYDNNIEGIRAQLELSGSPVTETHARQLVKTVAASRAAATLSSAAAMVTSGYETLSEKIGKQPQLLQSSPGVPPQLLQNSPRVPLKLQTQRREYCMVKHPQRQPHTVIAAMHSSSENPNTTHLVPAPRVLVTATMTITEEFIEQITDEGERSRQKLLSQKKYEADCQGY